MMNKQNKKDIQDIQSPDFGSTICVSSNFSVSENPFSGDFFMNRQIGKNKFDRDSDKAVIKINPFFFLQLTTKDKKAFALLLKIKQRSIDGRVWNYDPHILSREIGVSAYTIKKYIPTLVSNGYCYFNKQGDLVCLSLDKIMTGARKSVVIVYSLDSINNIVDKINYSVLKFSFSQQQFVRRIKRNEKEANDARFTNISNLRIGVAKDFLKERKACAKMKKSSGINTHGELLDYNILGMRKLSKIMNCSTKKACCLIKTLRVKNIIRTKNVVDVYKKNVSGNFCSEEYKNSIGKNAGYLFKVGSYIYLHLGTMVILSEDNW